MAASTKPSIRNFDVILATTSQEHGCGMGLNGSLPWNLPKDMKHFRTVTLALENEEKQNAVIMGRKTWESIPPRFKPLKGRLNVILSRSVTQEEIVAQLPEDSAVPLVFSSFDKALNCLSWGEYKTEIENVFIIGGAGVYEAALMHPRLNKVYLTEVKNEFECDVFFDVYNYDLEELERGDIVEDKDSSWQSVILKRRAGSIPWNPMGDVQNLEELQYLDLCRDCIENGVVRGDRTGTGTHSVFGRTMRFSLENDVLPLLTTKRTFWRGVAEELIWFVNGCTDANVLQEKNIHIWDGNASKEFLENRGLGHREAGDLGPVYGFQWRHFGAEYGTMHDNYDGQGVDQLMNCINLIKNNPNSRRIVMSAWNPKDEPEMALPPCHLLAQFYVAEGKLSCQMYQRSGDVGLGVPFNIASYALLTRMMAQVCDLEPGEFVHVLGDAHVYNNHVEPLQQQIVREPYPFPKLYINPNIKNIEDFTYQDFKLVGYKSHPKIAMKMAV